jgi:hypothetical protein
VVVDVLGALGATVEVVVCLFTVVPVPPVGCFTTTGLTSFITIGVALAEPPPTSGVILAEEPLTGVMGVAVLVGATVFKPLTPPGITVLLVCFGAETGVGVITFTVVLLEEPPPTSGVILRAIYVSSFNIIES